MKEHDWMKLYADAEKFMKKVGGTDFNIKTNIKTERWEERQRKEKAMMNVSALFGENAAPDKRCGEGIVNILKAAVEEIYTGGLAKVTLNLRGGSKHQFHRMQRVKSTSSVQRQRNRNSQSNDRRLNRWQQDSA